MTEDVESKSVCLKAFKIYTIIEELARQVIATRLDAEVLKLSSTTQSHREAKTYVFAFLNANREKICKRSAAMRRVFEAEESNNTDDSTELNAHIPREFYDLDVASCIDVARYLLHLGTKTTWRDKPNFAATSFASQLNNLRLLRISFLNQLNERCESDDDAYISLRDRLEQVLEALLKNDPRQEDIIFKFLDITMIESTNLSENEERLFVQKLAHEREMVESSRYRVWRKADMLARALNYTVRDAVLIRLEAEILKRCGYPDTRNEKQCISNFLLKYLSAICACPEISTTSKRRIVCLFEEGQMLDMHALDLVSCLIIARQLLHVGTNSTYLNWGDYLKVPAESLEENLSNLRFIRNIYYTRLSDEIPEDVIVELKFTLEKMVKDLLDSDPREKGLLKELASVFQSC